MIFLKLLLNLCINTLIGKIEQDGIGVIDIESKFHAAKASWISRILNENSVTNSALSAVRDNNN